MNRRDEMVTIAFRASQEQADLIDDMVDESGMTKQDYILYSVLHNDQPILINPTVYLQIKRRLDGILTELKRIRSSNELGDLVTQIEGVLPLLERMYVGVKNE